MPAGSHPTRLPQTDGAPAGRARGRVPEAHRRAYRQKVRTLSTSCGIIW